MINCDDIIKISNDISLYLYGHLFYDENTRGDYRYQFWRNQVLKRDNYSCVNCGSKDRLEAHHIIPWIANKKTRYLKDNGKTLCKECHKKTESYGSKSKKYCKSLRYKDKDFNLCQG